MSLGRYWLQGNLVAELLQPTHEMAGEALGVKTVEVVGAEFVVRTDLGEDVVGGDENRVADGDDRASLAASCREPAILRREVGVLGARGGPGGFDERTTEPTVAVGCFAGPSLTGALVVARTHRTPRGEMSGGGKDGH